EPRHDLGPRLGVDVHLPVEDEVARVRHGLRLRPTALPRARAEVPPEVGPGAAASSPGFTHRLHLVGRRGDQLRNEFGDVDAHIAVHVVGTSPFARASFSASIATRTERARATSFPGRLSVDPLPRPSDTRSASPATAIATGSSWRRFPGARAGANAREARAALISVSS